MWGAAGGAAAKTERKEPKGSLFSATPRNRGGADAGTTGKTPAVRPPYMTGYGALQPVAALFRLAREAKPDLKRVGVVWNPSEPNSEASTVMARAICKELGIELVEVTVDSSAGVSEAANAVLARSVQAIWAG